MNLNVLPATLASCALLGCGCASRLDEPGALVNAWAERFREFQIFPVFPPREDMQVGDIYLTCDFPEGPVKRGADGGQTRVPVSQLVATTPAIRPYLAAYYRSRVFLPEALTEKDAAQAAAADGKLAKMPRREMFAGKSETNRLRNVSMPELFSVTASGVDAGALLPTGILLGGLEVGAKDVTSVTISIPSSGSYGLPGNRLQELLAYVPINGPTRMLEEYSTKECHPHRAKFIVVSEIYAAHAINVHMNFTNEAAARVKAAINLPSDSARKAIYDALSKHFVPGGGDGKGADGKEGSAAESEKKSDAAPGGTAKPKAKDAAGKTDQERSTEFVNALKDLASALDQRQSIEFPGVRVSAYTGSNSGISLERKFANPVVIGYRGYSVTFQELDAASAGAGSSLQLAQAVKPPPDDDELPKKPRAPVILGPAGNPPPVYVKPEARGAADLLKQEDQRRDLLRHDRPQIRQDLRQNLEQNLIQRER